VLIQAPAGGSGGRYDKIHRVLFGEYVPLRDWLPWMDWFAPYDYDYSVSPGEHLTRFPVSAAAAARPYRFGVIICFEDTDPYLARQYVRSKGGEPAVDFLLNISNDGWFDGTSEHEEHLAICRFRAVECRRAVARAVNMGVSAVIDGSGRVLEPASVQHLGGVQLWEAGGGRLVAFPGPRWARYKKVSALLTAVIPIDRRTSLYAAWGDWLPWGCWLVLGLGLLRAWARSLSHQPLAA
jgi:apolipoprotein N-acyltransferase